jgi:DNA-binding response OmpR family regulator
VPIEAEHPRVPIHGRQILLVEDEALIGIMMRDVLTDIGFAVVGPITDVARALAAAKDDDISGAILDINLDGEPIYPVADALSRRGIPFVFLTGYGADGIDRRYAHVPALEKPIEPETLRRLFVKAPAERGMSARPPEDVATLQ